MDKMMSFRTQDDTKLLRQFLEWYDTHTLAGTNEEIVKRFIEEREAERAQKPL